MAIPIYYEGEDFYVPYFEVKIGGHSLKDDVVRDVMQVTYKDSIEEIDSFELVVNNWDADRHHFKYEPFSQKNFEGVFEPGQRLELWMGYLRNIRLMLKGEITTVEPNYPESGGSTLSVRGLNTLHSFRKKQHTFAWYDKKDSQIAVEIGKNPVSEDKPGMNVEVRIDDNAAFMEKPDPFVFMNNQFDILFLFQRARRRGYSVYLDFDKATNKEFIYFGPSHLIREVAYELEWGKSLIQFRPTLTTAKQIQKVTVRGWDRRTGKPIEATAQLGEKDLEVGREHLALADVVQGRHEVITDQPVHTADEAKSLAKKTLKEQLQELIKASGSTVGLPDLRAGSKVEIKKLGKRFDGEYFVVDSTHTINDGGYRTTFNARKEVTKK